MKMNKISKKWWFASLACPFILYLVYKVIDNKFFKQQVNKTSTLNVEGNINVKGDFVGGDKYEVVVPDFKSKPDDTVPEAAMIVKNEHKNYDAGADVFGVSWKKEYSLHTIEIRNKSNKKSMKQFSLLLEFSASVLHNSVVLENGVKGIKTGKDISIEMVIKGPLEKGEKAETKVLPMKPANVFNPIIEELFPEGSVIFRVILNNSEPQAIYSEIKYYYESGGELKQAVFAGNMTKDETETKFPNLKEIKK